MAGPGQAVDRARPDQLDDILMDLPQVQIYNIPKNLHFYKSSHFSDDFSVFEFQEVFIKKCIKNLLDLS